MHRLFVALRPPPDPPRLPGARRTGPHGGPGRMRSSSTSRCATSARRPASGRGCRECDRTVHASALELGLDGSAGSTRGGAGTLFARAAGGSASDLHKKLDRALVRAGIEPERRAYLPHITLARRRAGAVDPAGWLERRAGLTSANERVASMILYESHVGRHGSTYEAVASYPLVG